MVLPHSQRPKSMQTVLLTLLDDKQLIQELSVFPIRKEQVLD